MVHYLPLGIHHFPPPGGNYTPSVRISPSVCIPLIFIEKGGGEGNGEVKITGMGKAKKTGGRRGAGKSG